ncbi:FecCD family ABC transporter permease [Taibaiella soli]|uniref:Iron ABC transporter permease n=1 Tax=Taibaiella soli TaxID=1649169 RepID=A0A2W2B8C5_9BACT|nr:iron ABC transporter permease [Taibaiella soli]PZF72529.1 iron ABC transporter permease [Taibaiella soli]
MTARASVHRKYKGVYPLLAVALVLAFLCSVRFGAVDISFADVFSGIRKTLSGQDDLSLPERILIQIRLPRAILCVLVGAGLAVGGTLMQALFRNPIVEPGLTGTSSGAAFGAALYFVLGAAFHFNAGEWLLPFAAFAGAMLSTTMVFQLSRKTNADRSAIVALLLTGIAVNALFFSGVGFLSYIARDPQARSITFWNLGTLSGANWHSVIIVLITTLICVVGSLRYTQSLNALILGTEQAELLGVNVKKLKRNILVLNVLMIATATAFTGVISFVGLIVPHLLRLWKGADNRYLIIGSSLLGGILLTITDLASRLLLRPAEIPIGIVTALIGVPVFLILLNRKNYYF